MLFSGATALASSEPDFESLTVDKVWLTEDTLHISVTDTETQISQTLEMNLRDYAQNGDEYVTVQATDSSGNKSNAIRFKNPFYTPTQDADAVVSPATAPSESAVADSTNPFTPEGAGEVVDNATDADGKEFFTIKTADGNVFYIIVDRERTTDNVYLLNAVTENDLASLAKPGDGISESAVPSATPAEPTATPSPEVPEIPDEPETPPKSGGVGGGSLVFIILAALAVGGAGYYFKILRPKRQADSDSEEENEDFDDSDVVDDNNVTEEDDE
jgi:hypothetical protein